MKVVVFLACIACSACSMLVEANSNKQVSSDISVISWNLQTFFDSHETGTEYSDFKGSKTPWSEELYVMRLKQLAEFISQTQADVYVFQEIENSAIIQDLSNELVGLRASGKGYNYSCFSKQNNEALGIAILSRYPLHNVRLHQIDFDVALGLSNFETSNDITDGTKLNQPSMRALLRAQVVIDAEKSVVLYACHWKSKYGGAEQTEVWRNTQERLLADSALEERGSVLIAGDFNRSLEEFVLESDESIMLRGSKKNIQVFSPWHIFDSFLTVNGSYYYEGSWEKIDHFFYNESIKVLEFKVITNENTLSESGIPFRFDMFSGKGMSDHLPLFIKIKV